MTFKHACVPVAILCLLSVVLTIDAASLACTQWQVLTAAGAAPTALTVPPGATLRKYYISADVTPWTYTPLGRDNCNNVPFASSDPNFGSPNIRKALLTEYDSAFTSKKARPTSEAHLGVLGPIIRAVEGDYIQVTLRNTLPFAINLEPSGVKYAEPVVAAPGQTVTYIWAAPASTAIAASCNANGETSQMWHYRSTVDPVAHNAAGLFGPIVITRKGYAKADGSPNDVDRELFAVYQRFDDSLAPPEILDRPGPLADTQMIHSINGYTYCNQPGLTAAMGNKVRWYVMGLGNEDDVHTAHWHGITVQKRNQRNVDSLVIVPGVTHTVDSLADNPGNWLMHCHVNHHLGNGMGSIYTISGTPYPTAPLPSGKTRKYYLAAEALPWDYAPGNGDFCPNAAAATPFTPAQQVFTLGNSIDRIGKTYLKAVYIEYTDATFTTRKARTAAQAHLGLQGPPLYAEVGDLIQVTFKNKITGHNVSVHPHGVLYAKDAEGAPYNDGSAVKGDDIVATDQTWVYRWAVPERAGPGPKDASSVIWIYHSHTDEAMDTWAGLFGSIIVTRKGWARWDGTPADIDREISLVFSVQDESASFLLAENAVKYLNQPPSLLAAVSALHVPSLPFIPNGPDAQSALVLKAIYPGGYTQAQADAFAESNKMHSINGYSFCNLPALTATIGQRTRVYLAAFGDAIDLHTPNLFGASFLSEGLVSQSMHLLPGAMFATDLKPSVAGSWLLQCRVNDHINAGMRARMSVSGIDYGFALTSLKAPTRTFYISAEKVTWDYAPLGVDGCSGAPFTPEQQVYTTAFIGSKYVKAQYLQYADATWAAPVAQPATNGILGPVITANVGEVVEVVYRNKLPFRSSLKVLSGLVPVYCQEAGGWPVVGAEAVTKVLNAGLATGGIIRVRWVVPASAAVTTDSHGVSAYTYLSGVDEVGHTHAGLVGLVLVGRAGAFPVAGSATAFKCAPGVDFTFPLVFNIFDEAQSVFFGENVAAAVAAGRIAQGDVGTAPFLEASLKHSVNGRVYCNLPPLQMAEKQQGLVVLAGLGGEKDIHSPIFEGQLVEAAGDGVLVETLMPSLTRVATMTAGVRGAAYSGYCYVHDHHTAGMRIRLVVSQALF